MNQKISTGLGTAILLVMAFTAGYFIWVIEKNYKEPESIPQSLAPSKVSRISIGEAEKKNDEEKVVWKLFRDETNQFEFEYPSNLELKTYNQEPILIELRHSIPYENTGDCDMMEPQPLSKTIDDLKISFEVRNEKVKLSFNDGDYSAGILKGKYVYEGVEGCGPDVYYFPFGEKNTLVVKLWIPQLLSGNVNAAFSKEILSVPGVITSDESKEIFNQILSTFKIVE